MKNRVILSKNGVLTDLSTILDDYFEGSYELNITAATDKIFIGTHRPFNHIYLEFGAGINTETSSIADIRYWDSQKFNSVVEIIDGTKLGNSTFNTSGHISWVTDKDEPWHKEDTNRRGNEVTGLTDVVIYDRYWTEYTFTNDLTTDIDINWIGNLFSKDANLFAEFPEFDNQNLRTAFKDSAKLDWKDQHVVASDLIIKDLKRMNKIIDENQILDRNDLLNAGIYRTAAIIYNGLGGSYDESRDKALKDYWLMLDNIKIDENETARVSQDSYKLKTGRFYQ